MLSRIGFRSRYAWLVVWISILCCIGAENEARADVTSIQRTVIDTLSEYVTRRGDAISRATQRAGYFPEMAATWEGFPAVRKLEQIYKAAEAAAPGGGNRALATVAEHLSTQYESLRNNSKVRAFVGAHNSPGAIQFGKSAASLSYLSRDARLVIESIAEVAEGRVGGYLKVITADFGLSADLAYTILAESSSGKQALSRALGEVPDGLKDQRLNNFVVRIERVYPSAAQKSSVVAFKKSLAQSEMNEIVKKWMDENGTIRISPLLDPIVECFCGGVPVGQRRKSACTGRC